MNPPPAKGNFRSGTGYGDNVIKKGHKSMKENILVIGGAGYIGSHMCKYLSKRGYTPVTLDNFVQGHRDAVKWGPLIEGSLGDAGLLRRVFSEYSIAAVMLFAGHIIMSESVAHPGKYYQNNVAEPLALLEVMIENKILNLIFSSSCGVYGLPVEIPMTEDHPQHPINPYGRTKWMLEQILDDFETAYGLRSVCLRYFNAAGADPEGELGEDHRPETHLIPLVLQTALGKRDIIHVFGNDYPTPDGTCVRDYIHVEDLVQAHLLALERLLNGKPGGKYNLGNGNGCSVMEVIHAARRITGCPIPVEIAAPRPGDSSTLIGSSRNALKDLGWRPLYPELEAIIQTAWAWHKQHPDGYLS
jgi:UDP-glucose-4-epimerase GalE